MPKREWVSILGIVALVFRYLPMVKWEILTMTRTANTTRSGGSFDQKTINAVWGKGTIVPGVDPSVRRKDANGAWMQRDQYGKTVENGSGWEIDHIRPVASGGGDELSNLQPLQWQNNRSKGDEYPHWSYQVTAVA